jgi:hypothetical protein
MAWGVLPSEGQSLHPLPEFHHRGLVAITVLAFLSFFSSTALFLYLAAKFCSWYTTVENIPAGHQTATKDRQRTTDFTLGIDGVFSENSSQAPEIKLPAPVSPRRARNPPNQFLVLIFNLLLADMHQATAFWLNAVWLGHDGIFVGMPTCFAQGIFVSLGDLASSVFITGIAIHTYCSVVHNYRPPHKALYLCIVAAWVFVYAISFIPVAATYNGEAMGGFFVRAGAWVRSKHGNYELTRIANLCRPVLDESAI